MILTINVIFFSSRKTLLLIYDTCELTTITIFYFFGANEIVQKGDLNETSFLTHQKIQSLIKTIYLF